MAIRNIVKEGDEILSKKCRRVEEFDDRLVALVEDMKETLLKENGVGLAAPQVGILKRVIVVDMGEDIVEFINPEIIKKVGRQEDVEGCLSCPGEYGITVRPMKVTVKAESLAGEDVVCEGEGLLARAFCHEIDHLNGILFKKHVVRMLDESEIRARE